jgi:hypothetical protein
MPTGLIDDGRPLTPMPRRNCYRPLGVIPRAAGLGEAGRPGPAAPRVHLRVQAKLTVIPTYKTS